MPKIVLLVRIWTQRGSLSSSTRQVVNGNIEHLNCSTNIKTCNSQDTPINRLTSFFAKTFAISPFHTAYNLRSTSLPTIEAAVRSGSDCWLSRATSRKVRTGCFGFSLKNRFLFDKFSDFESFDRTWQCQPFMFADCESKYPEKIRVNGRPLRGSSSKETNSHDQFDGI